jgi:hypothetical protein
MISALAQILMETDPKKRVDMMFIDKAFGSPIVERLRALGHTQVQEIGFGDESPEFVGPRQKKLYANMRSYMWNQMKEFLKKGGIDTNDKKLMFDLTAPGFHFRQGGDGEMVIESKEDMRKRKIASPDDGDALALTFCRPVAPRRRMAYPMPDPVRSPYGWMG